MTLDQDGWVDIHAVISGAAASGRQLDMALLQAVVAQSDKQRFTLSDDGLRIRAAQGHSTPTVALQHQALRPPQMLYHGTATRFLEAILAQGLQPGQRHHVHVSADPQTATTVGARHGTPVALGVHSLQMHDAGFGFFQADNGVWLTPHVPPNYLHVLE